LLYCFPEAAPGFVLTIDKAVKPGPILDYTLGALLQEANYLSMREVLPEAIEQRCCHNNIAYPIRAVDYKCINMH
jgi:hypothetical protein